MGGDQITVQKLLAQNADAVRLQSEFAELRSQRETAATAQAVIDQKARALAEARSELVRELAQLRHEPQDLDLLDVFCARCEARALLVSHGQMQLHDAVDGLQAAAVAQGLIAAVGQDAIQQVMAHAFGWEEP